MITTILHLITGYKKYLMIGSIVIVLIIISYQGARIIYLKNEIVTLQAAIAQAKVTEMESVIKSLNLYNARMNEIKADTETISAKIKSLKIEGRCIKDDAYYSAGHDIADRFNRVRQ